MVMGADEAGGGVPPAMSDLAKDVLHEGMVDE
jgi:hypothetical protein